MKKYLLIFLVITMIGITSCGKQNTDTSSSSDNKKEVSEEKSSMETYSDDVLECTYDRAELVYHVFENPDNEVTYGFALGHNSETITSDVTDGNTVCFAIYESESLTYDGAFVSLLVAKPFFDGIFQIGDTEESEKSEISIADNDIYEYEYKNNEVECYGKLYKYEPSKIVACYCRIMSDTDEEQRNALLDAFESIKYKEPSESEDASDSGEITSGPLYESITDISSQIDWIYKNDDRYSIVINENNPKKFFDIAKKINQTVFTDSTSVVYTMSSNKDDVANIAVVSDPDSSFKLHSTLTVFDSDRKKKIEKQYQKNKYWKNLDLRNQSNKELEKIMEKYSN